MSLDLMPFFVFAIALVVGVIALALWRKVVAKEEDDTLHILGGSAVITHQVNIAHKLDMIDKWGKILTAVAAFYLLILFAVYLYQMWSGAHASSPI
jgi:hypothetical protein